MSQATFSHSFKRHDIYSAILERDGVVRNATYKHVLTKSDADRAQRETTGVVVVRV